MNNQRKDPPSLSVLILLLLGYISTPSLQAAQFELINEETIPVTDLGFLGKPRKDASGQGQFAPLVFKETDKPPVSRIAGAV